MTKKTIITIAIAVIAVAVIGLGTFIIIRLRQANEAGLGTSILGPPSSTQQPPTSGGAPTSTVTGSTQSASNTAINAFMNSPYMQARTAITSAATKQYNATDTQIQIDNAAQGAKLPSDLTQTWSAEYKQHVQDTINQRYQ